VGERRFDARDTVECALTEVPGAVVVVIVAFGRNVLTT
jgi:hypothetical protein